MQVKFHGYLSDEYQDLELKGRNVQVIFSGLAKRYPGIKRRLRSEGAQYAVDGDTLHILPKGQGAWIIATIQIIGAIGAVYGASVAINQKRIQKQNKQKQSREAEGVLFEGIINTDVQGGPIPLAFGEVYGGSVVINNELEPY